MHKKLDRRFSHSTGQLDHYWLEDEASAQRSVLRDHPDISGVGDGPSGDMMSRLQQRKNVLKALARTTWGFDKETLLTTYKAIDRSILNYCCLVWTSSLIDTNWSRLQRVQNSALRIATDCLKMADVAELHQEARELPVRITS